MGGFRCGLWVCEERAGGCGGTPAAPAAAPPAAAAALPSARCCCSSAPRAAAAPHLRGPHLVLPHAGGDDGVALGLLVQHLLRGGGSSCELEQRGRAGQRLEAVTMASPRQRGDHGIAPAGLGGRQPRPAAGSHDTRRSARPPPCSAASRQPLWLPPSSSGPAALLLDGPLRHDDVVVVRVGQRHLLLHRQHLSHPVRVLRGGSGRGRAGR